MSTSQLAAHSNQWMLFGIDMRRIGHFWLAAWRDLLFASSSPLRHRLDEPVLLRGSDRAELYHSGVSLGPVPGDGAESQQPVGEGDRETTCVARQLPDELVLTRNLDLPLAAEAELHSVLAMEIAVSSPFAAEDTVHGYTERGRDDTTIGLTIAIASRAAVARWLRENPLASTAAPDDGADRNHELWAAVPGGFVTLGGYGEGRREQAYRKRLMRCGLLIGGILALVLVAAAVFALQQRSRLERMETLQSAVQQETRLVASMREALADANATIVSANEIISEFPNPHVEIARLTELMDDSVYVAHFSMRGRGIRLRGRASDAATVMQTLAQIPAFDKVTAPQAITAVGNTGLEQFHLDIELSGTPRNVPDSGADGS